MFRICKSLTNLAAFASAIVLSATPTMAASSWMLDLSEIDSRKLSVMNQLAKHEAIIIGANGSLSFDEMAEVADEIGDFIMSQENDTMLAGYFNKEYIRRLQKETPDGVQITFPKSPYPETLMGEMYGSEEIDTLIREIRETQGITDNMPADEKLHRIAQWFADNMTYDLSYTSSGTIETARTRRGVCYQLAKLFTYICRSCDIECRCETGFCLGGKHEWVTVQINGTRKTIDPAAIAGNHEICFYMLDEQQAKEQGYQPVSKETLSAFQAHF